MKIKIKRFVLCLTAVAVMSVTGSIHAVDENDDVLYLTGYVESETEDVNVSLSKREESVEPVNLKADDAERLLKKIGNTDGLDIYVRSKNYKDEIWNAHGGNPKDKEDYDKNSEPSQEQLAAESDIELLNNIGYIVAVDPEKKCAVASFKKAEDYDGGKMCISEAGRYLLTVNEDYTKALEIREIVTTIDDPFLFRTSDGKKLVLTDNKYSYIKDVYRYKCKEDGKLVFESENNKTSFVWLSEDMKQVYGTFRYCAENENFRMLVDDRTAIIGLENKETGYIWWSSPLEATRDEIATPILIDELRSSTVLRYGIPEKRSMNNFLRSTTDSCKITVKDIVNGVRVEYNFAYEGFSYPVEYTIAEDYLSASLKVDEIQEKNSSRVATEITLIGSFGAASSEEQGYFVIPDGSGALINFNNGKGNTKNSYSRSIYGDDITAVPARKGAVTEQIYLPVYGIVKEDNAILAVAVKGDSNAALNTEVSGQSNSSYNICNFTFSLRSIDTFYMSGTTKEEITVFERGKIKSDDIEVRYYPISGENVSYVDVAERYRTFLTEEMGITKKTEADKAPLYIDLYGGTEKEKSVLGIPVTVKQVVTDYSKAEDILKTLKDSGVDKMVVSYNNWTKNGIMNKIDTAAKPAGVLGGKNDFSSLSDFIAENDISFYPVADNCKFYSGNGYNSVSDTAVRVSGAYSRIVSYDRAYGIPDGFKDNMSLLSPSKFKDVFSKVGKSYAEADLYGIALSDLTSSLYGDYGKKEISRNSAQEILTECYDGLIKKLDGGILADTANAYALPYVSHITGVPLNSSGFDIFDKDIPFYQLVIHGIIPYSTTAINGCPDSEMLLLKAISAGSNIYFDMIYEQASELKDTEFDVLYYANYDSWKETAASEYKLVDKILSGVSDCLITGYNVSSDGEIVTTEYSDGTEIIVDFAAKTINRNGEQFSLKEYAEKGGIRF